MEQETRSILLDFIQCYRKHPALWNTDTDLYLMKDEKLKGYQDLQKIYKKVRKSATITDVKKKINILRCTYRRELKKVLLSEKFNPERIYKPTLWWYEAMDFIRALENSKKNKHNIESISFSEYNDETIGVQMEEHTLEDTLDAKDEHEEEDEVAAYDKKYAAISKNNVYYTNRDTPASSSKRTVVPWDEDYASEAARLQFNAKKRRLAERYKRKTLQLDTFDYMSRVWAAKLRKLPTKQRLLAEKSINDILFEAEMGNLKCDTVQARVKPRHSLYSESLDEQSMDGSETNNKTYCDSE